MQPLPPSELTQRSLKLFNPNFRSPRRIDTDPKPSSISWSKLPPPAAELDERSSFRVRRFKLWKDVTPELRKVVLDPKKRAHLRRYQSYAIPATPFPEKRLSLPVPLPRPTSSGVPTLIPNEDEWSWTTPVRIKSTVSITDVDVEDQEEKKSLDILPEMSTNSALIGEGELLTPPLTAIDKATRPSFNADFEEGFVKLIPIEEISLENSAVQLEKSISTIPDEIGHSFKITEAAPNLKTESNPPNPILPSKSKTPPTKSTQKDTYWLPPIPDPKNLPWYDKSIAKKVRKINYQRLLEHQWILDQEHERRFRIGMGLIIGDVLKWQEDNTIPQDQWKKGINKWKDGVDLDEIKDTTELFKLIRKKSTNIFQYLNPDVITFVPFRDRVHELVRNEEARKRRKKEKREAKKRAEEIEEMNMSMEKEKMNGANGVQVDNQGIVNLPSGQTGVASQNGRRHSESTLSPLLTPGIDAFNLNPNLIPPQGDSSFNPNHLPRYGINDEYISKLISNLQNIRIKKEELQRKIDTVSKQIENEEGNRDRDKSREREKERFKYIKEELNSEGGLINELTEKFNLDEYKSNSNSNPDVEVWKLSEINSGEGVNSNSQEEETKVKKLVEDQLNSNNKEESKLPSLNHSETKSNENDSIIQSDDTFRFGSLNLDNDTLKPSFSEISNIPSSAFSRNYSDLTVSSNQSVSTFEGDTVTHRDILESIDQDTLVSNGESGDTKYSKLENSSTSHMSLA